MSAALSDSMELISSTWSLGSISSRASAATSSSREPNTASRSAGASSSRMSAISAGWSFDRRAYSSLRCTRRAGSVSIRSTASHGIARSGMRLANASMALAGAKPLSRRRSAPRNPTSTWPILSFRLPLVCPRRRSTSLTRTTLRPWTSIIC